MSPRELNNAIERLRKRVVALTENPDKYDYYEERDKIREEAKRLYYEDREFRYMSKKSVLIIVSINLTYRFEPFHYFGSHIKL